MNDIFNFAEQPRKKHFLITTSVPSGMLPSAPEKYRIEAMQTAIGEALDHAAISPDGSVACRLSFLPRCKAVAPVLRTMVPTDILKMNGYVLRGEILLEGVRRIELSGQAPIFLEYFKTAVKEAGKENPALVRDFIKGVHHQKPELMLEALDSLHSCALEQMAGFYRKFCSDSIEVKNDLRTVLGTNESWKQPRLSNDSGY